MFSSYISLEKSLFHWTLRWGLVLDWSDRENIVQETIIF